MIAQPTVLFAQELSEGAESDPVASEAAETDTTIDSKEGYVEVLPTSAVVEQPAELSGAKVAWMLTSSALVLMMTAPGLALFYGGLVRKKNILGVMMQCIFLMGLMTVLWGICGYSLAFGGSSRWVGNFDHVLMKGIIADGILTDVEWANNSIFFVFQGMFFIITPALICGAFAERMKFSTMCVFSVLWGLLVYCPICHWVWAESGWLCEWNPDALYPALDFAGGTVVHISSGVSALLCALLIGKRIGYPQEPMPPHNLTYTCIGAALLWVGWFGFNAGSAVDANAVAVNAFVATHMCAAAGVLGWSAVEWLQHGKPSILGACSGAVAGLVCITPASGSCTAVSAIPMGIIAGVACYYACAKLKKTFGYDDSLDAFGVHGVGGTVGALLTGVFASKHLSSNHYGVLDGMPGQMVPQIVSIAATAGFALVGTFIILKVLDALLGLRVSQDDEVRGLDVSQHGEEGYIFL
ncbi:MAG: ammonium transporter [Planctomycetota bacterium]|nr:ammonium transporter [Planctomycetota bacterium]MDA1164612.1 ammonium transporter [Planctomycetota bacterium]